ncbi:MAG TPA: CoA transferase [Alphaproteobacteria bacterium]|nr:CoA transferase [Alphaproteobacteria bacterium]
MLTTAGALDGIRVIDLTSHLSGPYCTMILADLGADVIKVERAGAGDDSRHMPPHTNGEGWPFMLINRNKRSVALDLKDPDQLQACTDLAAKADIFVENFKPGTIDRMGLGYDKLSHMNPRLIFCSISGFGQTGPLRDRGGFDLMTQAMSGLMSVCGPEDGPPHRLPVAISDIGAGMFAAIGILGALAARQRTGRGQRVDAALYDAAIAMGVYEAAGYFATGTPPARLGQGHRGAVPYQVFQTADGWLTIGAATQHLWERFCRVIGRPDLMQDPRFTSNAERVKNRAVLVPTLATVIRTRPTQTWAASLMAEGIPVGPVQTYDQVFADPQVKAREMAAEIDHPAVGRQRVLGVPYKLSETPATVRRPAPRLGEHTDEVLGAAKDAR